MTSSWFFLSILKLKVAHLFVTVFVKIRKRILKFGHFHLVHTLSASLFKYTFPVTFQRADLYRLLALYVLRLMFAYCSFDDFKEFIQGFIRSYSDALLFLRSQY